MIRFIQITAVLLLIVTAYYTYACATNAIIEYAEEGKISLKEESVRTGRTTFFYDTRRRSPSGGGWGFGK